MKANTQTTMTAKEIKVATKVAAKRMAAIAACPMPDDISKPTSKRPQYSVKAKKRLAKHAIRHGLTTKEVSLGLNNRLSAAQVKAWMRDTMDGRFDLKHSVSVSRA